MNVFKQIKIKQFTVTIICTKKTYPMSFTRISYLHFMDGLSSLAFLNGVVDIQEQVWVVVLLLENIRLLLSDFIITPII